MDIVVYIKYGYGSLRIFPREVVGCMTLIVWARSIEIQHWYVCYSSLLHFDWVECWCISYISWYMVEGFWLWCVGKVIGVVWGCISVRVWCLVHVRVITLDHGCIHMYGTWLERYKCTWLRDMYDDVCIGNNYKLDTMAGYMLMWQRKESVWV